MDLDIEIRITSWEQRLSSHLQNLLNLKDFCDLKIYNSANQCVYCHQCVVTAFIPFIKAILVPEANNATKIKDIYLPNVSQEIMQKIVAYCYGGVLSVSAEQVGLLLVAAEMLQMTDLQTLLAAEQSKMLESNLALVKKENAHDNNISEMNNTELKLAYVVNDADDELPEHVDEETDDTIGQGESIEENVSEAEHCKSPIEVRKGSRKRKRKVFHYATKKVPLKKQKTSKAQVHKMGNFAVTKKFTRGKKRHVKIPISKKKNEMEEEQEFSDQSEGTSPSVTETEDIQSNPLMYEQFVKEIAPDKFTCKVCKKVWPSWEKTLTHVPSHSEDNLLRNLNIDLTVECVTCNKWFSTKSHLRAHIKDVHLNPCRKKVFNAMFAHLSPFQCPVCEKTFKWASDLKQHVLHHGERQLSRIPGFQLKYACDECRLAFITKSSFKSHQDLYHVEDSRYVPGKDLRGRNVYEVLYKCDLCSVSCDLLEQIEDHVKKVHAKKNESGDQQNVDKTEAGMKSDADKLNYLKTKSAMLDARGSSDMEKVLKILKLSDSSDSDLGSMYSIAVICLKCHAEFSSVNDVKEHKRSVHPWEKPLMPKSPKQAIHMCDLCGVCYKNNHSLLVHKHVVHNIQFQMKRKKVELEKPDPESLKWDCLYCSKKFKQRCGLRIHVVTHHTIEELKQDHRFAERDKANYEYQCHLCKNKMKLYKSLQTHLRRFHGVRISRDSASEYFDYNVVQKKKDAKESKPEESDIQVESNVIVNQEQVNFELASSKGGGEVGISGIALHPGAVYQQPVGSMQDVGGSLVQPYQTQDYVVLNTGLQLTFSGYPPVQ